MARVPHAAVRATATSRDRLNRFLYRATTHSRLQVAACPAPGPPEERQGNMSVQGRRTEITPAVSDAPGVTSGPSLEPHQRPQPPWDHELRRAQRRPEPDSPAQREPAQGEPAQGEPARREPAQREPAQREPARREPSWDPGPRPRFVPNTGPGSRPEPAPRPRFVPNPDAQPPWGPRPGPGPAEGRPRPEPRLEPRAPLDVQPRLEPRAPQDVQPRLEPRAPQDVQPRLAPQPGPDPEPHPGAGPAPSPPPA